VRHARENRPSRKGHRVRLESLTYENVRLESLTYENVRLESLTYENVRPESLTCGNDGLESLTCGNVGLERLTVRSDASRDWHRQYLTLKRWDSFPGRLVPVTSAFPAHDHFLRALVTPASAPCSRSASTAAEMPVTALIVAPFPVRIATALPPGWPSWLPSIRRA